jgi:hypothetical protein
MPTDPESTISKKAMAFDLIQTLKENPDKQQYTTDEIEQLINAYINGLSQK